MKCCGCQEFNVYCYFLHFGVGCLVAGKCVYRLLFNKIVVVELILAMEWTFSCLLFILGGNADHRLVLVLQKWQEQDAMRK